MMLTSMDLMEGMAGKEIGIEVYLIKPVEKTICLKPLKTVIKICN